MAYKTPGASRWHATCLHGPSTLVQTPSCIDMLCSLPPAANTAHPGGSSSGA
ncbi:hypothetical protein K504DRAFT_460257 [Pleomassaria siparia CBS 279.74]|uniref:Uncharacterized protein n=1 Tax=Pleomassaria siparia CBS 279.74 TaxID=1314801 RepID=A0A6G1JYG0_9PLEO|nr:hypothetical protein K504DRAFT_460257 [Pleomassaria siparia CBS 279.74]